VDIAPRRLGLTKNVDVGICGDARLAAEDIAARLKSKEIRSASTADVRSAEAQKAKKEWEEELAKMAQPTTNSDHMPPRQALTQLEKSMPKVLNYLLPNCNYMVPVIQNAVVATDIGNICSVSNSYLRFDASSPSMLAAMSFGNCGYAFPAAMGAKVGHLSEAVSHNLCTTWSLQVALPERPCVAYVGDGAWGMSLNEILTCVRENIPTVAVVFNNGQWGAEKKNQVRKVNYKLFIASCLSQVDFYSDRFLGTNLSNPCFADIARAMGAEGQTVSKVDDVSEAFSALLAKEKAAVLEIVVSQDLADPFRRDALRKPVRRLKKYEKYE